MTLSLSRWTPTDLLRDHLDRMFNQMTSSSALDFVPADTAANAKWIPDVDIREGAEKLVLTVDLPGMKREDVHVTIEEQRLTITGERRFERDTQAETLHRVERAYGSFSRTFGLPPNLATDKVEATFQDGVLTLLLPKSEGTKPRRIEVR
jgi:HSP20 family protein